MRSVSLNAGLAHGYVHSIVKDQKDPTISNLVAVCREVDVSLSQILYGVEMTPEVEQLLYLLADADREDQAALLTLLRNRFVGSQKQLPGRHPAPNGPEHDETQKPS
jgi:hypothetical protein